MRNISKDLRVQRTIKGIRDSFSELVLIRSYEELTIKELAENAKINRKTFYLHFSSLDDVIEMLQNEVVNNFLSSIENETSQLDVAGCINKFYHYLNDCGDVEQRLLCHPSYSFFYENVTQSLLESPALKKFYENKKNPFLVRAYCVTITSMYRSWLQNNKPISLDELIKYASDILLNGYNGSNI